MKISYNWLKQYANIDLEPERISTILTDIGLEVEGLEKFQSVKGGLEGIVIGEVITCIPHPNADKLSLTTVNVGGDRLLPIVCGAPNVTAGQKVVVATVGTALYYGDESFKIKKANIRGEVSEGMICAEDELGLGISHEGIMVLANNAEVGLKAADYFDVEDDYIFEIGLTPNRSDATSHIGTARDLVAGLNQLFNTRKYSLSLPAVDDFTIDNTNLDIDVIVEDIEACPRYSGISISGIKVAESPDWLKIKLNSIGVRPINNIVDITNYVLHETGQPLHAFDADMIKGSKVVIRKTEHNTPFTTLDSIERKLDANDLMICHNENGMCIAGVFGGTESGVTSETVNIFLESAYFDPKHIRKTAKRHGLQSDASFRFERGADPNITIYALKRAAILIKEIAGGSISSEIKDVYSKPVNSLFVDVDLKRVDRLIGKAISRDVIKKILADLEIIVTEENDETLKLSIPTYKVDVTREVDIVEEILRIYGYNNIEISGKLNSSISARPVPDLEKIQNTIADYLAGQGMLEIMNNSLTKADHTEINNDIRSDEIVNLLNPLSKDLNILRPTLLYGGLETVSYNLNRKSPNLKLFEFGSVYSRNDKFEKADGIKNYLEEDHLMILATGKASVKQWNSPDENVNFYFVSGLVNSVFTKLGIEKSKLSLKESESDSYAYSLQYMINDELLAEIGLISTNLLKKFDIGQDVFYADINWTKLIKYSTSKDIMFRQVPKFPAVKRDLSLVLDNITRFSDLKDVALKTERKLLKNVDIFDIYKGSNIKEGKKSYALSFILQDESKTLTDKVIDSTMNKILRAYEQQFNAQLR
ncbi:MAG: phenylalanine--tRNA ligase subunit beta [Bacteroidales bacterium]|nr:phenylalanine--tRNA ligase subunit beta [Bacteroidales bacterium]